MFVVVFSVDSQVVRAAAVVVAVVVVVVVEVVVVVLVGGCRANGRGLSWLTFH